MAHIIPPTIGRKVWFRPNGVNVIGNKILSAIDAADTLDALQAMDATIVCVIDNQTVNLLVVDHAGESHAARGIRLVQPLAGDLIPPEGSCYCEWMPFQIGQSRAQADVGSTAGSTP